MPYAEIEKRREYKRLWRLRQGMVPFKSAEIRFFEKIKKVRGKKGCWLWTAQITPKGYPIFHGGRSALAHRFSYEFHIGIIPEGFTLDHLCKVRHCVNPKHLEAVTGKVNTLRGDGPTAKNARKTHCHKGHELNEKRKCIPCRIEYQKKWYLNRKKHSTPPPHS